MDKEMEEFVPEFQEMDNTSWWTDLGASQLGVGGEAPLSSELAFDDCFQWLSSPEGFTPRQQMLEINSEHIEFFGPTDPQRDSFKFFSNSLGLHNPIASDLASPWPSFPASDYDGRGVWPDNLLTMEVFSIPGSSMTSDAFSPSSEMLFSSPGSPITPMAHGLSQNSSIAALGPMGHSVGLNETLSPSLGELGNMELPAPRPRPPPRRGRPRNRSVGHLQIPARARRMAERPMKCGVCGMGFPFNADLQKHITARHTTEKETYRCPDCPKLYTRKDRVQRHGKEKHGWPSGGRGRRSKAVDGGTHG